MGRSCGKGSEFQGFGWNAHRNFVKFYFSHKRPRILERTVVVSLETEGGAWVDLIVNVKRIREI